MSSQPWGKCDRDVNRLLMAVQAQGAIVSKQGGHIIVKGGTGQMVSVNSSKINPRIFRDIKCDLRTKGQWQV